MYTCTCTVYIYVHVYNIVYTCSMYVHVCAIDKNYDYVYSQQ